jgi:ribosomal protein L37AE/L43A
MTLPSEEVQALDRERVYSTTVDVWQCRDCGETYDFLPRVRGMHECLYCGAGYQYLERTKVAD